MTSTRRRLGLAVGVSVLVLAGVAIGMAHDRSSPRSGYAASGNVQPGWHGRPEGGVRPAEQLWTGEVSLVLGRPYGLDERPDKLVEPCGGCLKLETQAGGAIVLHAENGIVSWPQQGRPSYYDCVHLRESGTEDFVSLAVPGQSGGLAPGAWICATGRKDDIVRLRYEGTSDAGYLFDVTAWHRPFRD
jgi:hypothetical protein